MLYVGTGVLGLAAFAVLMGVVLVSAGYATLRAPPRDRPLAAAVAAGIVASLVGTAAYDQFSGAGSAWPFWLLVALALAVVPARPGGAGRQASPGRLAIPAAGLLTGLVFAATAPRHTAIAYRFETMSVGQVAASTGHDERFTGRVLIHTACSVIRRSVGVQATTDCLNPGTAAGMGYVRLEARTPTQARELATASIDGARAELRSFRVHFLPDKPPTRPTWAATMPVWATEAGVLLALIWPVAFPGPVRFVRFVLSQ
jgi:hypothetical protein